MKPEAVVSRDVQALLKQLGFAVWSTEQGYRAERGGTRQTPGIPDLIAINTDLILFIELKAGKNAASSAQLLFGSSVVRAGGHYRVIRSSVECFDWLVELGVVEEVWQSSWE